LIVVLTQTVYLRGSAVAVRDELNQLAIDVIQVAATTNAKMRGQYRIAL